MRDNTTIKGLGIGYDIVFGKVFYYCDEVSVPVYDIEESEIENELQRFDRALRTSEDQLNELQLSVVDEIGDILQTHIIMLHDNIINNQVKLSVSKNKVNVESIYSKIMNDFIHKISSLPDKTLAERSADIVDVRKRVLKNLRESNTAKRNFLNTDAVIVAKTLTITDTLNLENERIAGLVIETGGITSHVAILARSLGIPAIFGVKDISTMIEVGDTMIVDGTEGSIILNPDAAAKENFRAKKSLYKKTYEDNMLESQKPTITLDNTSVDIQINIDTYQDVLDMNKYGCCDVGLYRTEFLYMSQQSFPNEQVQFEHYKDIVSSVSGVTTIRTLDLGGDKIAENYVVGKQKQTTGNSFLGWRAIRYCLANVAIFKTQLRAILRASAYGKLRILIPMITILDEIVATKNLIEEVKSELLAENIDFDKNVQMGIMIETPSSAINADIFAKHVDFFSIGSNDLIQYTLACDRTDENVSYLYRPLDPSILKLIKMSLEAALKNNINISMCGEMAAEVKFCPLLFGLGVRSFSMSKMSVPNIKRVIRQFNLNECEKLASVILDTPELDKRIHIVRNFYESINIESR